MSENLVLWKIFGSGRDEAGLSGDLEMSHNEEELSGLWVGHIFVARIGK
jgi:hypothetical protein